MIINYETNNLSADIFKGLRKDNFIADYEENDICLYMGFYKSQIEGKARVNRDTVRKYFEDISE